MAKQNVRPMPALDETVILLVFKAQ